MHDLQVLVRLHASRAAHPTAMIVDSRTLQSTPESGVRVGYDGAKRRKGAKVHAAVDTLGHLLALHVTPADAQDRAQVGTLAATVQDLTGQQVTLGYVSNGASGGRPASGAWRATTSASPRRPPPITTWPSPASCSRTPSRQLHNML